jgi:hypothetical protein
MQQMFHQQPMNHTQPISNAKLQITDFERFIVVRVVKITMK